LSQIQRATIAPLSLSHGMGEGRKERCAALRRGAEDVRY